MGSQIWKFIHADQGEGFVQESAAASIDGNRLQNFPICKAHKTQITGPGFEPVTS